MTDEAVVVDDPNVEAPVTSDNDEPQVEAQTPDGESPDAQDTGAAPKRTAEKRIKQLTRNWREEQRRNDELAAKLAKVEEQVQSIANPAPARPNPEDYETQTAYEDALFEWRDATNKPAAQEVSAAPKRLDPTIQEHLDEGIDKYDDFQQVVFNDGLALTDSMLDIISSAEKGADVLYQLGKNPQVAAQIAALPKIDQARELGKIEAGLSATRKPVSTAPKPIEPVGGQDAATADISKLPPDEYRKAREAQWAKRGR